MWSRAAIINCLSYTVLCGSMHNWIAKGETSKGQCRGIQLVFLSVGLPLCFHCHYSVCFFLTTDQSIKATQTSLLSVVFLQALLLDKRFLSGNIHLYLSNQTILSNPVEHFDILHYFIMLLFCVEIFFLSVWEPQSCQMSFVRQSPPKPHECLFRYHRRVGA